MSSKIPLLKFDELPDAIAARLQIKYERLGYLGEFFARTAHQEKALAAFIDFTDAAKGALDMSLVELIALTIAEHKNVAYERNQHERLSVKLGFGHDWIRAVQAMNPQGPEARVLSETQRVVQEYIIQALESDGHEASPALDRVVMLLGHEDAVAVMMVMARYVGHALMINSMKIAAPVASIFQDANIE
jgi:hypothetical protein